MQETVYVGRADLTRFRYLSPSFWVQAVLSDIRLVHSSRHILQNLVRTQLTTRYHRSSLGFIWTLLHPVLLLSVQAVVFSAVFGQDFSTFVVYLFAGMVAWQFFASGLDSGSRSLVIHEGMLRKVAIPKLLCPLTEVLGSLINLIFATLAIFVILLTISYFTAHFGAPPKPTPTGATGAQAAGGATLHPQVVLFPVAALLLGLFVYGVSLIGMTVLTWFRDVEHMLGVFLNALYFSVPIVYPLTRIPPDMLRWLKLNPVFHYIMLFQDALYYGRWPTAETWTWCVCSAVIAMVAGYITYKVFEDDYVYHL